MVCGDLTSGGHRDSMLLSWLAAAAAVLFAVIAPAEAAKTVEGPPVAPVRPVTDTYFGTAVVDNHRYLENLADPDVQAWMKAQADYTRLVLDRILGRAAQSGIGMCRPHVAEPARGSPLNRSGAGLSSAPVPA